MARRCPEGGNCQFTPDFEYDPQQAAVSCEKCGASEEAPSELEQVLRKVEAAIDDHPRLVRVPGILGEPQLSLDRLGVTLSILVSLSGSRQEPVEVSGDGECTESALANLADRLDRWAETLANREECELRRPVVQASK